jgi:spore coat polysaccharide biosynthesis protein SpsF
MKNETIYGFITVRTNSTRLPKKCLLTLGQDSIIEHVIKRCLIYNIEPVVCTTSNSGDDVIEKISNKLNVKCFRGSSINKLKRWADCAIYYNIEDFHTVDADDPFFDGDEMKFSMKKLREGSYDIVSPTISSSNGGASVGYSLKSKVVLEAIKNTKDSTDTEMIESFFENINNLKIYNLKDSVIRPSNVRLTLDYEEDYLLLKVIVQILGENISRKEIDSLFVNNPDLSKINWFRNIEWKAKQNLKINK